MNTGIRHQLFLVCEVKERSVRHARLLRRRARIRGPRIEVRVEVDDRDGAVDFVEGPEDGEHDRVVAAKGHDARVRDAVLRERRAGRERGGVGVLGGHGAREEGGVRNLHLVHSERVVERAHGHLYKTTILVHPQSTSQEVVSVVICTHIAAIYDPRTQRVRVVPPRQRVPARLALPPAARANRVRTETRP